MRYILILALALVGCHAGRDYIDSTAREVSQQAFGGKYDDKAVKFVTDTQGEYNFATQEISLHGAWVWAPHIYLEGVLAHEMIHHDLYVRGMHDPAAPHNNAFWNARREVAKRLDIPVWAIPSGKEETWIDAQKSVAYCEAMVEQARHRFPVSLYSAVDAPIAVVDPFAYSEE